jgi:plasmid stabilization system protein ParE
MDALRREARDDLLRIYVLIGSEQRIAAERYFDRIDEKVRLLACIGPNRIQTKATSRG